MASCGWRSWRWNTSRVHGERAQRASPSNTATRSSVDRAQRGGPMTLVAGVDSSTQSCTVVVRDAETGALVRSGNAKHPDGTEVHPSAWWDALQAAIGE